jgi:hypothetical protein
MRSPAVATVDEDLPHGHQSKRAKHIREFPAMQLTHSLHGNRESVLLRRQGFLSSQFIGFLQSSPALPAQV